MTSSNDLDALLENRHFDRAIIIPCVRWYVSYKTELSESEQNLGMLRTTHSFIAGNGSAECSTITIVQQSEIPNRVLDTRRFTCEN